MLKKSLLCVLLLSLVMSGCDRRPRERSIGPQEAEACLEKRLEEKYGQDFTVQGVSKYNLTSSGMTLKQLGWEATITTEAGESFDAYIDNAGMDLEDKYAEVVFSKELEEYTLGVLNNISGIDVSYSNGIFQLEECTCTNTSLIDFLQNSDTQVSLDIHLNVSSIDEAAQKIDEVAHELAKHHIKFMITFEFNDIFYTYTCTDSDFNTITEIKEGLMLRAKR